MEEFSSDENGTINRELARESVHVRTKTTLGTIAGKA